MVTNGTIFGLTAPGLQARVFRVSEYDNQWCCRVNKDFHSPFASAPEAMNFVLTAESYRELTVGLGPENWWFEHSKRLQRQEGNG